MMLRRFLIVFLAAILPLLAQPPLRTQRPNAAEIIVAIMPLTGAGTDADPKRPALIPARGLPAGVTSYSWLPSDNGQFAIVQLGANHRAAFTPIAAASGRNNVRVFDPHKDKKTDVERELKLLRKNFAFEDLSSRAIPRPNPEKEPGQ